MTKLDFNPVWRFGPHGYGKLQEEDQRATAGGSLLKKDRFAAHWHLKKKQQQKKETSPIKKVFAVIPEQITFIAILSYLGMYFSLSSHLENDACHMNICSM